MQPIFKDEPHWPYKTLINNGLILETDKEGEYVISCEIEGEIRTSDIIIYKDQNAKENSNFIKGYGLALLPLYFLQIHFSSCICILYLGRYKYFA